MIDYISKFKEQENEKTYKLYADHTDSYYFKSEREFAVLNGKNEVLSDYSCESVVELINGIINLENVDVIGIIIDSIAAGMWRK